MVLAHAGPRLPRVALTFLVLAGLWTLLLFAAAFLLQTGSTESASSTGEVTHGSTTLVGEEGLSVVLVLAVPLLVTVAVGAALWHHTRRWALATAWTLTGVFAVFNLLAMLSVGVLLLPVTAALVIACLTTSGRPGPTISA